MEEDTIIPFTPDDYGTMLELLVNFANRIILKDKDDLATGPIDPMWPLIRKHFKSLHDAPLPERPADSDLLKWGGPSTNTGGA
jgi:hypothetical protein